MFLSDFKKIFTVLYDSYWLHYTVWTAVKIVWLDFFLENKIDFWLDLLLEA